MTLFNLIITLCFYISGSGLEPGLYESNNDLIVEMRISSNRDSVTFYFPSKSEKHSNDQWSRIEITPNYRYGVIKVEGNQIYFEKMESDMLPSSRPKLKPMKFENGIVYLDCENMSKYLFGRTDFANCNQEFIEFNKK